MTHPIAWGDLLAYFLDDLSSADADALEEHLFACDACAERASRVHDTGGGLVELVRSGSLGARSTIALLNRCSRDRLNVRRYILYPGQVVACTVRGEDDFVLAQLVLDRPAPARVDLAMLDAHGAELLSVEDVVVDPRGNQVLSLLPARPLQDVPSREVEYVLFAVEPGRREVIGRYRLDHTAMREA